MRKIIVGFIAGLVMATSISVYADEGLEKIEAYVRAGLPILLDGKKVELENPPVMVDGSTYLRLRDVAKITGVGVNWNEATQTVELTSAGAQPVESKQITGGEVIVPETGTKEAQILELKTKIAGAQQGIDNLNYFVKLVEYDISRDPNNENHKKKLANYQKQIEEYQVLKAGFETELAQLESGTP